MLRHIEAILLMYQGHMQQLLHNTCYWPCALFLYQVKSAQSCYLWYWLTYCEKEVEVALHVLVALLLRLLHGLTMHDLEILQLR